jgi:putative phosphoesterase
MRLGIISDTHGYFHPSLPDVLKEVDLILHAGDIGDVSLLDTLETIAPTHAVWGNIDGATLRRSIPEHQRFTLSGLTFWITHIGGRPGRWDPRIKTELYRQPPDVFVCGHSHILRIERVNSLNNMLYINPGAAGRHGFHQVKTCVRMTLEDGTLQQAEVVHLDPLS